MVTTIQIDESLKEKLDHLKVHHRETYNELLIRLVHAAASRNQDNESLTETIEVLSDSEALREIAEALDAHQHKRGKPLKQLRKELGV